MIAKTLEKELNLEQWQVNKVIKLIDEGNTIPFIARYRKDVTGSLNDELLRKFDERLKYLRNLEDKKTKIIERIDNLGKLDDNLKNQILNAETLVELDDLYRPYKSKKRTRATIAKQKGLEPLASLILAQEVEEPVSKIAENYVTDEVKTPKEAIEGAQDIIAEIISDNSTFRKKIRQNTFYNGVIETKAKNKDESASGYEIYFNYSEKLSKIPPHRILAINRAENEGIIKGKVDIEEDDIIQYLKRHTLKNCSKVPEMIEYNPHTTPIITEAIEDSYKRLISPAIEREIRSYLTKKAEEKSIEVFAKNLSQLLMESPLSGKTILGWDPAFRTGCKLAVIDSTGKVLETSLIYPTEPQNKVTESKKVVLDLIKKYDVDVIAIGNGTASRESESFCAELIKEYNLNCKYVITSEAGASIYSASKLAIEEFPDLEVEKRSAVSIARRIQDPLSELVKIDPKSIGVGEYQYDVNQKELNENLDFTVSKVVNEVGVNVNTASKSILKYVSGLTKTTIDKIYNYKEKNKIVDRDEIKNIKGISDKVYEQCIGFLRVMDGTNAFDKTGIHPESYPIAANLLNLLDLNINDINSDAFKTKLQEIDIKDYVQKLNTDEYTLSDIVKELLTPGLDPRDELEAPILKSDILHIEDLNVGMELEGTVRNVASFGAFVDIGLHDDGLVHISKMSKQFVKNPNDILNVGDIIKCYVDKVDLEKGKVNLSLFKE